MDARRELLADIRSRLAELSDALSAEHAELGRVVHASRAEEIRSILATDPFAEAIEKIATLRTLIPERRKTADRILELAERSSDIEGRVAAAREEMRTLERRGEGMAESIGQAAYAAYIRAPQDHAEHQGLFAEVIQLDTDIQGIDRELNSQDRGATDHAFVKRIRKSGRRVYLTSRRLVKANALSRALRVLGRTATTAELIASGRDPQLSEAGAEFHAITARIQELSSHCDELGSDHEALRDELVSLDAPKRHQKKVEEIQTAITVMENELARNYATIGSTYLDAGIETTNRKISEACERIRETQQLIRKHTTHADRLEAALEIDALDKRIRAHTATIETLEKEIRRRQTSADEARAGIQELEQEKKRQEKQRGSTDTLLEYEVD